MRDVTRAVLGELAHSGYAQLRIEDVAARARVNKTTIYRRWPTKAALVAASLRSLGPSEGTPVMEGSLEAQLLALVRGLAARAATSDGRGFARIMSTELDHPEFAELAAGVRKHFRAPWLAVIRQATERGELPPKTDARLIVDALFATVAMRIFRHRDPIDDEFLRAIVALILIGAKAGGAVV